MSNPASKLHVYYDGTCRVCSGFVDTVGASSRGGLFERHDASSETLPSQFSRDEAMHDIHVVDADGEIHRGANAIFRIMDEYTIWRPVALLGRLPGMSFIARVFYRLIAENRYRLFGKLKRQ